MSKISKVYQVSDEEFIKIIQENFSYSDCLKALGLSTGQLAVRYFLVGVVVILIRGIVTEKITAMLMKKQAK